MFNSLLILISTVSVKFSKKSRNKRLQSKFYPRISIITQPPHLHCSLHPGEGAEVQRPGAGGQTGYDTNSRCGADFCCSCNDACSLRLGGGGMNVESWDWMVEAEG